MSGPPSAADRAGLAALHAALDSAGYTRDNVLVALQTDLHLTPQAGEVVVFERRVAGRTPLETLMKLFLIGSTVAAADVDASLPQLPPGELGRLGLVETVQGGVRSTVRLIPHGDIVIACDRNYYRDPDGPGWEVVTGVNSPAVLLADLTVRKQSDSALDLGTGGGIQAMLLANHCGQVVGVDVNPRALRFADLNAALNGVDNLELRLGSWFEPVAGERFDLITANPPYVMSPDSSYLYRDSGMRADSLCRQLVRKAPDHLQEGGFAHFLVSWAMPEGEDWATPLQSWTEGLPCDVWLLHYLTDDPLSQAAKWTQPTSPGELDAYAATLDRWTDYYRREGIAQIGFGAVIMRRRTATSNWVRTDSFKGGHGSSGALVLRVFGAEDHIRTLNDDHELLGERFGLVPEHRMEQRLTSRSRTWELTDATLSLTEGIAFHGVLDLETAQLLQRFDGTRTLGEAVSETTIDLGLEGADAAQLAETAVTMVKRLYQLGFLVRSSS